MEIINILTVFILAIFVGFEIIAKVPPTLHTPLMSGSMQFQVSRLWVRLFLPKSAVKSEPG